MPWQLTIAQPSAVYGLVSSNEWELTCLIFW